MELEKEFFDMLGIPQGGVAGSAGGIKQEGNSEGPGPEADNKEES